MGEEKKPKRTSLGEAVSKGIIANETLAYFIGRTYLFAQRVRPAAAFLTGLRVLSVAPEAGVVPPLHAPLDAACRAWPGRGTSP